MKIIHATTLTMLFASAVTGAEAESRSPVAGPVEASVVQVMDGDTFLADARVWPGHTIRVSVRIRGIDAPEIRTRCEAEKLAGEAARERLVSLVGEGPVLVSNIGGGKYYGRVLADVFTLDGLEIGAALLDEGHAVAYDGGRRTRMCEGV
jgi:micrococcal nuclease